MGYRTYALAEGSDIDTKETLVTGRKPYGKQCNKRADKRQRELST